MKLEAIPLNESLQFARRMAREFSPREGGALVVALVGDLGAGKTTFTQTLAQEMGITEDVTSPTFVLEKIYQLPHGSRFTNLVHIDAYRLNGSEELGPLGWDEIVKDAGNLVLVEWADRVKEAIPAASHWIFIEHGAGETRNILWEKN